eukprot:gene31882-39386_t
MDLHGHLSSVTGHSTLNEVPNLVRFDLVDRGTHFEDGTLFINASTCTGEYRPTNKPIVIHLPFDRSLPAVVVPLAEQVLRWSYDGSLVEK